MKVGYTADIIVIGQAKHLVGLVMGNVLIKKRQKEINLDIKRIEKANGFCLTRVWMVQIIQKSG